MLYEPPLHEPVDNNLAVAGQGGGNGQDGELEQALVTFQTEITTLADPCGAMAFR
jgi:hypothetical protein